MNTNLKYAAIAAASVLATLGVTSVVHHSMDKGIGHFANADADNNGEITTAEWSAAAAREFKKIDNNNDGKLVVGEIPRGPEGGPRHGRRHGPDDEMGPDEATAAPAAPLSNAVVGNAN